jgi:AraC-like DNA-binding protein
MPPKSSALTPLYRNCLFRSDVRVEAHEHVARELVDHALRWKRGAPEAAMYKGEANRLKLYLLQYGAEVEVTPGPFDDFVLVHTSLAGGAEIETDGRRLEVGEGRTAVLAPKRRVRLCWFPGTQQLIVKVPNTLIREVAAREEDEALGLASGFVFERGHGSQWKLLLQSLLNAMSMPQETALPAAWLDHFEHNMALFLLSLQPGEVRSQLAPREAAPASEPADAEPFAAGDARIDALMDYIDARLAAPVVLADLARAARVSVRTLNELCRRHHGVTPMELLRNRRLDAVRTRLRLQPELSVTETALAMGFGHPGRFSQYYFERFGELPSQTQAKRGN